jgi:hypothetical protein
MEELVERIDLFFLDEAEFKRVIRKGKVKRKLICPPGFKAEGKRCVKIQPKEKLKRLLGTKQRVRKLKAQTGIVKKANRKRAKSMRKRAMMIPQVGLPSGTPETE